MATRAVFRVDASPEIGGGHVMRCLTLAAALADEGWQCGFAVGSETLETVPALDKTRYDILVLNDKRDEVTEICKKWDYVDFLVVDHYKLDAKFETACYSLAKKILVIDDLANRPHNCDYLINPGPGHVIADYTGLTPEHTHIFSGEDYAILRPEFSVRRFRSLSRREMGMSLKRILVSFGATDAHNMTSLALRGLERAELGAHVDVVLGPSAPDLKKVRKIVLSLGSAYKLHIWADNIAELMENADLAIGGVGATALERCCVGLPSLSIVTADNQEPNAAQFSRRGGAIILGNRNDVCQQMVAQEVRTLAENPVDLHRRSLQAARICDGLGVRRIFLELISAGDINGCEITLRPAKPDDMNTIFRWQYEPGKRKFFHNPVLPSLQEHRNWFRNKLDDPFCLFNIIECNKVPAGLIRLDFDPVTKFHQVSILVSSEFHQMGIGKRGLALTRLLIPHAKIRAEVHAKNTASMALFSSAGYHIVGGAFESHPVNLD